MACEQLVQDHHGRPAVVTLCDLARLDDARRRSPDSACELLVRLLATWSVLAKVRNLDAPFFVACTAPRKRFSGCL